MNDSANIAIIGAGVVGSTVARLLQADKRKFKITIIADSFRGDTTSAAGGGIFRPGSTFRGPNDAITKKWINDSWYYWQDLMNSPEGLQAGLMPMPAFIFSRDHMSYTRNHLIEDLVPIYRPADKNEMALCGKEWKFGSCFSTIRIGCERYLPWAERKFLEKGGRIVTATVRSFGSLAGQFDLVFNCAGYGARALCNDIHLTPVRGQVLQVRAPWVKTAYYGDQDTYIIPGFDGKVTLGGVRHFESYNNFVCDYDAASIFDRCCKLLPSLADAEILGHKVGLRPHRLPVRVEPEIVEGVKVVHCYGHGGYGVTCAPGTAIDAVNKGMALLAHSQRTKL